MRTLCLDNGGQVMTKRPSPTTGDDLRLADTHAITPYLDGSSASRGKAKALRPFHSAFFASDRVAGFTHNLYRYPARFSPEFARACVVQFTEPGDLVLDPFLGGGTSAVESLAAGRRFAGFDLNPLAVLLTRAKTTPLYRADRLALEMWLAEAFASVPPTIEPDPRLRNAPPGLVSVLAEPARRAGVLPEGRRRDAARAVLLSVGQWAIDGRNAPVAADELAAAATAALGRLLSGLDGLREAAETAGIRSSSLPRRRVLRSLPSAEAAKQAGLNRLVGRARLVVTSPPYPGVHVLYHRWQVRGRAETPLPYWLAGLQDGLGPKHYTMGGRTSIGEALYFGEVRDTWQALRRLLHPDAVVVQLVAFSRPAQQLDRYLGAMEAAGYHQASDLEPDATRLIPNRRWYNRVEPTRGSAREVLLAHRLSR